MTTMMTTTAGAAAAVYAKVKVKVKLCVCVCIRVAGCRSHVHQQRLNKYLCVVLYKYVEGNILYFIRSILMCMHSLAILLCMQFYYSETNYIYSFHTINGR